MGRKGNRLVVTLQQFPVVDLRVGKDQSVLHLHLRLNFLFLFCMVAQSSLNHNGAVSDAGFPFESNSICVHLSLP